MRSLITVTMPSLSTQLRERTSPLHRQIESLLRLPGVIKSREEYRAWLSRYLGFYDPLEGSLAVFPELDGLGFQMATRAQACCLVDDLVSLGSAPAAEPRATQAMLPHLPSFAHALGAFYVVEGATLGGRLILRDLEARLSLQICGATRFFGGRGDAVGPMWHSFRAALDDFGLNKPQLCADAVIGAERTFVAMQTWFVPFCAARVSNYEPS